MKKLFKKILKFLFGKKKSKKSKKQKAEKENFSMWTRFVMWLYRFDMNPTASAA